MRKWILYYVKYSRHLLEILISSSSPKLGIELSQFSSVTRLCLTLATPWTAAGQASLSITNSWSLPKLRSIKLVMPSNHLILCRPFSSCLQFFPASGFFLMSQFFASGGQSTGASAGELSWMTFKMVPTPEGILILWSWPLTKNSYKDFVKCFPSLSIFRCIEFHIKLSLMPGNHINQYVYRLFLLFFKWSQFIFVLLLFYSYIFWLYWVFVAVHWLSLVVASGGHSVVGLHWLLVSVAFLVAAHRLWVSRLQ